MNLKEYNKLCRKYGKAKFNKKYVFEVWVKDPEFKTHAAAQARASGHRFDKVPSMQADLDREGQVVPGSVKMKGSTPVLMDGYTRYYALVRKEEQTGVKQYMLVSKYHHSKGMTDIKWLIFQWRMNEEHLTSSPNTREDYEKFIAKLYESGYWDDKFGFTQEFDLIGYRDSMLEDIDKEFKSIFRSDVVRRIVERVLGNQDYCPDFWTYDKTSATKAAADAVNLEWSGTKTGDSDNGTTVYLCAMDATIRKDQVSYALNLRHSEITDKTNPSPNRVVICFYEKSMEAKDRAYLSRKRSEVIETIKKYKDSPVLACNLWKKIEEHDPAYALKLKDAIKFSPANEATLWNDICFLPQDKSCESEKEVIWATA